MGQLHVLAVQHKPHQCIGVCPRRQKRWPLLVGRGGPGKVLCAARLVLLLGAGCNPLSRCV